MIQLLLASYKDDEVLKLETLLGKAETELQKSVCVDAICATCEYKHLCYDLQKARKFVEDLRK